LDFQWINPAICGSEAHIGGTVDFYDPWENRRMDWLETSLIYF
jgi:hypothetical protein